MKRINDRPFLVVLGGVMIAVILLCGLMMEYGWFGYSHTKTPLSVTPTVVTQDTVLPQELYVNINTASKTLLDGLPYVGPVLAERIVEYREQNGPFSEVEQLKEVKGIGDETFEQIRPYVTVD